MLLVDGVDQVLRLERNEEHHAATDKMDADSSKVPQIENTFGIWEMIYLSLVAIADYRLCWPMLRRHRKLRVVVRRPPVLVV